MDRVFVGSIGRAHGVKGAVVVRPDSDHPARFDPGSRLLTDLTGRPVVEIVQATPDGKGNLIVRFAGVSDRTAAEGLRGAELFITAGDRRPLSDGEYWSEDLVGLEVRVAGESVGRITDVDLDAAQTRITVALTSGGSADVPFVEPLVPVVDLIAGYVEIADVEGLLTETRGRS